MAEYGQVVGQTTGAGGGGGAGTQDLGAGAVAFVTHAVNEVSSLPPETLLLIVALIFIGLIVLRRAF
jgi:hypothetical protein